MKSNQEIIKQGSNEWLIEKNGHITLKGKATVLLFQKDETAQIAKFSYDEKATDLILFVAIGAVDPSSPEPMVSRHVVTKLDSKTGQFRWRSSLNSSEKMLPHVVYQDVIICGFDNLIYGLKQESGLLKWGFWVQSGFMEAFAVRHLELHDGTLNVQGENWGKPVSVELNAATGERVYKKTKYTNPIERPFYSEEIRSAIIQQEAQSRIGDTMRFKIPGQKNNVRDNEAHLPAPVPQDWDAIMFGQTTLAWSLKTGEGIIIDPVKSDVDKIVEVAQQKIVTINGKQNPVRWLYVLDTGKIYEKSKRQAREKVLGHQAEKYPLKKLVYPKAFNALDPLLGGEQIDAAPVAKALNAKTWVNEMNEVVMTEAGPLIPKSEAQYSSFEPDAYGGSFLALEWGPYQFPMTHIRLIPSVASY